MKRRSFLSATAAASLTAMAGCATPQALDDSRLTFLSHYTSGVLAELLQELVARWNKENPAVPVDMQTVSFDDLLTSINIRQTGGQAPDIMSVYSLWGGQLVANGALDPPPTEIDEDIRSNFTPAAVQTVVDTSGQLFGYPTEFKPYVLFYNKVLFERAGIAAPPRSWDEFARQAELLAARDATGNDLVEGASLIQGGDNQTAHVFQSLLDGAGERLLDAEGGPSLGAGARDLMRRYAAMQRSHATVNVTEPSELFPAGRMGMALQAPWWVSSLRTELGEEYADTVGVAPVPGPDAGSAGSLASSYFLGVSAHSKRKADAWRFLSWLNGPATGGDASLMGDALAEFSCIPPRASDAKVLGRKWIEKDPNLKPVYEAIEYSVAEDCTPNAYAAKVALHTRLTEILSRDADPDRTYQGLLADLGSLQ